MHLMKNKYGILLLVAVLGGVYLSIFYVNPYSGVITLSELVLQLSGSRGSFALGFSHTELVSFGMRLFPAFIFELFGGIMLYQHFCTASIFVFSRYPRRLKWYIGEVGQIGGTVCCFHILLLLVSILTTICRYKLQVDGGGIVLLAYYFLIYSLWGYIMTILINLLAIYLGSGMAYGIIITFQSLGIVLFIILDFIVRYSRNGISYQQVLTWNPIAHLVFAWHKSNLEVSSQMFKSYINSNLNQSLGIFFFLAVGVTLIGAFVIKNHDLLIADMEMGVA